MTTLMNLRCEYLTTPLGIDTVDPRLSWELLDQQRGARQTAYQIQVASSLAALHDGTADIWDSGVVESDQSAHVVYAGAPLASSQRVYWRVRVWDMGGQPSEWSTVSWWEMGLLTREEWHGMWIGGPLAGGPQTTSPAPFLRTSFTLDRPVASARLYASALGLYEAHLNGQRTGEDVFTPGWTDYAIRTQYQVYDVTDLLHPGENVLGAMLGDGWYCGHVEWRGRQRYGDRPRLLAQLVVTFADGSSQVITTDGNWKVNYGPLLESDMMMGESYDARRELTGWDAPGYDDTRWLPVEVFVDPGIQLSAMRGPTVKRISEITPIAEPREYPHGSKRWIFDFGQNMVGRVRLQISGAAGQTVTLHHAEVLTPEGDLYTANLRSAKQTNHYVCKGGGEEVYEPFFTFQGFRYVALSGFVGTPTRAMLTGVVLHSALETTGTFSCSNPLLNQLQHNIEWGQRGNFVDLPTDCPQRDERLGWLGDAQVFIRTAAFNMDVAAFFTRWCRDIEDGQTPEGAYPSVVPNTRVATSDGGPAWADAGVICPWTIWQCYGDTRIIEQRYASMAKFVAYMREKSRNLIRVHPDVDSWGGYGDWLAQDGPGNVEGVTPKELIGTAFFSHSARLLADMAVAIGKTEDAAHYRALAEDVRQAFLRRFVTPEGQIVGNTQTSYVLALHFDLLPVELRPAAVEALVRDIKKRGTHLSTGFVGTPYLNQVLAEHGQLDLAYALLNQTSWPSWLYSVTQGATTIWERWDGWTHDKGFQSPGMNSFNHYAYGAIGAWMYTTIGGIDLDANNPGYKHIVMRPRPGGGITHASAALHTIYGRVASEWSQQGDTFHWQISVPPNTRALVHVPVEANAEVRENGAPVAQAEGVRFVRHENGAAVFEVAAGTYRFEAGR